MRRIVGRLLAVVRQIGVDAEDSDEVQLQKTLLVGISLMIIPAAILWGLVYVVFGEPLAGSIPLSYGVISSLSIFIFSRMRGFRLFRFTQLFLIVLLPFLLMISLGGFVNASAVILWSLLGPLGALVFGDARSALYWFASYVVLVVASGFLQPYVRVENNLSPLVTLLFFVMNIAAVSGIAFVMLTYFVNQKDLAFRLLSVEREKSESLLLNVLPEDIASTLKAKSGIIANHHDEASVLFADLAQFTVLSSEMSPEATVNLLNQIFSHFDALVERYGVEKIRTIGDNYMVASGVPGARHDHAQVLALLALDMLSYTRQLSAQNGHSLDFRIGLNSGPLVAGVIGQKKFHYDVWGDTVNTASRMESQGVPGKIQITEATREILGDDFVYESRGRVSIKGKGEMRTWFLTGAA